MEHYAGKFEEFQSSLASSNKLFEKLRGDMESGAKARSALAAERDLALKKAGQSDMTIVSLVRDRDALKKALAGAQATSGSGGEEARKLRGQKDALEGLCRALQVRAGAGAGACILGWGVRRGGKDWEGLDVGRRELRPPAEAPADRCVDGNVQVLHHLELGVG